MIKNISWQATTADWITGNLHLQPPRRTVRADFPHTALRQSLVTRHARGVEGRSPLQVQKSIAFQSCIQTLTLSKGATPPLAPVQKKSLKPTSHKMVHGSKHFTRIPIAKVVRPPSEDHVDLFDHLSKGLLIPAPGLLSYLVPQTSYGLFRRKNIQVMSVPSPQIPVIAKGKPKEVQRCSPSPHPHDARLVPVQSKSKACLKLLFYPPRDTGSHVSRQNHKIVGISHQSGVGHLV